MTFNQKRELGTWAGGVEGLDEGRLEKNVDYGKLDTLLKVSCGGGSSVMMGILLVFYKFKISADKIFDAVFN